MTVGQAGSVSGADSAALVTQPISAFTFGAALGEKERGTEGGADKAWSRSCRGSVRRRDRVATWQEEAKHDHFLTPSLIRLSAPPVILNMALLSHAALTAAVCACMCVCAPNFCMCACHFVVPRVQCLQT